MMNLNASSIASLKPVQRAEFIASLDERELKFLATDWRFWARPAQLPPPGAWRVWLVMAGRGFGKTRCGAEWVREQVRHGHSFVNLIGATADDARDIMVEGESGILAVCPPGERPDYIASKRQLKWPNGAKSLIFTADEPDRLRGKQHGKLWCDELASWRYQREAWDQAMFGLRLGRNPQVVVTTTPKPTKVIKDLLEMSNVEDGKYRVAITGGSTYDNRANLAPAFVQEIVQRYEGTRLGQQELYARLLEDVPGALWTRDVLEKTRVSKMPDLSMIGVAIDPAVTATDDSDETGIIVGGVGEDGHAYIFQDDSGRYSPEMWAARAIRAYHLHEANAIIAEVNNGGDLVRSVILNSDRGVRYEAVRATRGKYTRAEPVAQLYEQGRVHHVGVLTDLEDQLCTWVPGERSPDRLDALVWLISRIMHLGRRQPRDIQSFQG